MHNKEQKTAGNVSRRAVIVGLVSATTIGKSEAAHKLTAKIQATATELAALMAQLHGGGAWYAEIDHEDPFVLIGRDLVAP